MLKKINLLKKIKSINKIKSISNTKTNRIQVSFLNLLTEQSIVKQFYQNYQNINKYKQQNKDETLIDISNIKYFGKVKLIL